MPLKLSSTSRMAGTISSFVLWHLQRESTPQEIRSLAQERRSSFSASQVNAAIDYWQSVGKYGKAFSGFSQSTPLSRLKPPGTDNKTTGFRFRVDVTLNVPNLEGGLDKRVIQRIIDTSRLGTVADVDAIVRADIIRWLTQHYAVSRAAANRRKITVSYTGVEGI